MNSNLIRVAVNADEIIQGEAMILTLKDQEILNGNEINEDNDVLENELIRAQDEREFKKQQAERVRTKGRGYADKYDDEGGSKLLAHYDEQKMEKKGFLLDEDGNLVESKEKQIESIANKLKRQQPDLNLFFEDKIASDYLPQETQGFKKRKSNKSQPILELEQVVPAFAPQSIIEDDDYTLLQRSLEEKMRHKMLMKATEPADEKVKALMVQCHQLEVETKKRQEQDFAKPTPKLKAPEHEEIKVLTQSTDFLKNIKTDMELQESSLRISAPTPYSIRDSRDGTTSILNVSLPTERFLSRIQNGMDVTEYLDVEEQQDLEKIQDEVEFMEDDKHGFGLASTLKNLRERGLLKEQKSEYIGRSKDSRIVGNNDTKEIVLEYRNDKGKLMTQREAFRYQCHIFHGKRPSKNKIEKQQRKLMQQEKIKQLTPGQTPLMKALRNEQQKTNLPYMVISSKKQFDQ